MLQRLVCAGLLSLLLLFSGLSAPAWAFCGFYVARADTKLLNKASQVAIARNENRTVLTMANDIQTSAKDFAMVVPVPVVLQKEQVHVGNPKTLERLDAFSAPRLVEYFDSDPCATIVPQRGFPTSAAPVNEALDLAARSKGMGNLGVTVEAKFNVGEYDILILSAKESNGLETWLRQSGYKIPRGAADLFRPYIRQNLKFFVAKVNLAEYAKTGYQQLRPLQIAYESPKFMLPIRLGMINAGTEQDLMVYILSPQGQAEVTNYRTVNIPTDANVPLFVKNSFGDVYKALFSTAYNREGRNVAFREYAWNMSNCDPCSADPLSPEELKEAGVFWLEDRPNRDGFMPPWRSSNVFLTRLHVRYARDKFPEDLMFQTTANQQTFQGRYVLTHPFKGDLQCAAGQRYKRSLGARFEKEAQTLAKLTGWSITDIRKQMGSLQPIPPGGEPWWRKLWNSLPIPLFG
jgi:hypothetical protein